MTTIGQIIAGVRAQVGYSVDELSARTSIRESVIRAIERDDFTACGGNFYARGHIRGLARALGIDPQPLIDMYDEGRSARAAAPPTSEELFRRRRNRPIETPTRRRWPIVAAALVATVGIAAAAHAWPRPADDAAKRTQQAAALADAEEAGRQAEERRAGQPTATPATEEVRLRLEAMEPTWLSVSDAEGKDLFTGTLESGESRDWVAPQELRLHVGNVDGVRVEVNGEPLEASGFAGGGDQLTLGPEGVKG
ncbi:helix-turn-helix domain-containing protein [Marinactinospora rubrisoli]|uniref:Helix-turn-helix domain-containing protein n=1 Tax=Marinactinospora rubrisoli TaxID=2715399 RepID=A0ABW2KI32_9ACTN